MMHPKTMGHGPRWKITLFLTLTLTLTLTLPVTLTLTLIKVLHEAGCALLGGHTCEGVELSLGAR